MVVHPSRAPAGTTLCSVDSLAAPRERTRELRRGTGLRRVAPAAVELPSGAEGAERVELTDAEPVTPPLCLRLGLFDFESASLAANARSLRRPFAPLVQLSPSP